VDERRLDVVLMVTVANFEDLERPTRHDLRQFAELFTPLFRAAGVETKRTAAAALSRCPTVPGEVILQIASEDVDISAPFLAYSPALTDLEIAEIVERCGAGHARSLARRNGLSARAVALLASTGDGGVLRSLKLRGLVADPAAPEAGQLARDEELRRRLKAMVGARERAHADGSVPPLSAANADRLMRFAEEREALYFATALADVLGVGFQLAERIMLDVSGADLAKTLTAIGLPGQQTAAVLSSFFPHLGKPAGKSSRAEELVAACDPALAAERLAALIRADRRARGTHHEPHVAEGRKRPTQEARPTLAERNALRQARG